MWDTLIVDPMSNFLLLIYQVIGQNFGLAIILFTLLVRLLTYPLTASQMKSTAALQEMQKSEKWQEIQKKHKGDREKLAQEQMKLYQEMGINPFGSCLPTLIQFPVIIGLYQAVISAMAATPLQLIGFADRIYDSFPNVATLLPLNSQFLWMDLSQPERFYIPGIDFGIPVLAVLVVITSFLQTKLMTPMSTGDAQGAAMTRMMTLYMPLLIGWLAYSFPAGLAVYFVASNVVGIAQYALMGRLNWRNLFSRGVTNSPSISVQETSGKTKTGNNAGKKGGPTQKVPQKTKSRK
ncbi:MAG TPA: YidC/Oxa1 family membrane protein insertase [Anaerolineales bacterium]|nr:YidC/Oxa1 family membrane protein insertase [Anaerolineales bacterium]